MTLTLAAAVTLGRPVTVGYAASASNPLRDLAGNAAASFTLEDAANVTPVPETTVASVLIASSPSLDVDDDKTNETYGRGEHIRVKVTWSGPVTWDVSASDGAELAVRLDVGGTVRTAGLLTGGAARGTACALTFRYTVVEADSDTDGIAVTRTVANDIVALSGGATLKDAQGRDASRVSGALAPAAGHQVDGSKTAAAKDETPPKLVDASASGTALTLIFDEDLAAPGDRDALRIAFIVQGAAYRGAPVINQSPTRVVVSGPTVTLTLGSGIAPGRPVTVNYERRSVKERYWLRDLSNNAVVSFPDRVVDNATPVDDAAGPGLVRATVEGRTLALFFDRALDAASAPAGGRFQVYGDDEAGSSFHIRGADAVRVRVHGLTVRVALKEALPQARTAWVAYDSGDEASPLRGAAGRVVADIGAFAATALDGTGPAAGSGSVSGRDVTLYFDEALDVGSVPAAGDFAVTVADVDRNVDAVTVRGSAVFLTLASEAMAGETVKVSYTKPTGVGARPLMDMAGNEAATFDDPIPLTNEGTSAPAGAPAFVSATVTGDSVELMFMKALDPTKVPANDAFTLSVYKDDVPSGGIRGITGVTVRGKKVVLRLINPVHPCDDDEEDEDIRLEYVKPASNALRSRSGTAVDSFPARVVTNATEGQCTNGIESAHLGSVILRGKRPFATGMAPRAAWFTVAASGGAVTVNGAAFSPDDAHELKLTLSRDIGAGETVTVSYTRPAGERGLWDVDGNQLADVVDLPVTKGGAARGAGGRGGGAGLGPGRGPDLRGRRRRPGAGDLLRRGDGGHG